MRRCLPLLVVAFLASCGGGSDSPPGEAVDPCPANDHGLVDFASEAVAVTAHIELATTTLDQVLQPGAPGIEVSTTAQTIKVTSYVYGSTTVVRCATESVPVAKCRRTHYVCR